MRSPESWLVAPVTERLDLAIDRGHVPDPVVDPECASAVVYVFCHLGRTLGHKVVELVLEFVFGHDRRIRPCSSGRLLDDQLLAVSLDPQSWDFPLLDPVTEVVPGRGMRSVVMLHTLYEFSERGRAPVFHCLQ